MPNTEIDYSNTIFYKIHCMNPDVKDVYIGHTTNFVQRKCAHKRSCTYEKSSGYNCKVYNVIRQYGGWDNWKMEIIAFHNCEDHYTARKLEQKYFEEYNATMNSIEPLPKPRQVKIENKLMKCDQGNGKITNEVKIAVQPIIVNPYAVNVILGPKSSNKFICKTCDYSTCKNSQYERHLSTHKHKRMTRNDMPGQVNSHTYICMCGKQYRYRQGLFNHKKSCKPDEPKNVICQKSVIAPTSNTVDSITDTNTVLLILKQNQEFKQLIIEQHAENMLLHKELINKVNANAVVNNATNHNT